MKRSYYVTTPIYYANAEPHIGHTYTTVVVDTLVRWHRARGAETWSVSGTDEHGEKMVEAAAKRGIDPASFTEQISALHQRTWAELGLAVSRFVRTTDPKHVANVQRALQHVYDQGWIEQREYEGLYCVGCERFLTERDMVNGLCRDHERAPEPRRETNYFFKMSREFAWLREHILANESFIRPERFRNEALAMLRDESGLGDLSISRPKERLDWGIELPFDRAHVCYVWFDALLSYLTGAGWPDDPRFEGRWENAEHLIGKDILKPPRDLLADHAEGARARALPAPVRARLLDRRRAQGLEEPRQHGLAAGDAGALRLRAVPVLPAARDELRPRRELQRGGARRARERRSRQQPRQPGEPHAEPDREAVRRGDPEGGRDGRRPRRVLYQSPTASSK